MTTRASVPCDGCRLCCQGNNLVTLHPEDGDVVASYAHHQITNPLTGATGFALDRLANGDCVYLGPDGCTIHDRAPAMCRKFDCRAQYLLSRKFNREDRRRMHAQGVLTRDMLEAGRRLLDKLGVPT